jgi:hypothetical protein
MVRAGLIRVIRYEGMSIMAMEMSSVPRLISIHVDRLRSIEV